MGIFKTETAFTTKEKSYLVDRLEPTDSQINIQGAKNSALPILMAGLLMEDTAKIKNVPTELGDVIAVLDILKLLGCEIITNDHDVIINASKLKNTFVEQQIASQTRYSVLLMGVLISKFKETHVPFPGGCHIGNVRPLNIHLDGLRAFGVYHINTQDRIILRAPDGIKPAQFRLKYPSVSATQNLMITACFAEGETTLTNCAREPEVEDLARFLNKCGAGIKGIGTRNLIINGTGKLKGREHSIIPDRIEAGTYIGLAAMLGVELSLSPVIRDHILRVLKNFQNIGLKFRYKDHTLEVNAKHGLKNIDIKTGVYPGVPTDMQPIFTSVLTKAKGKSVIKETVFKDRFAHVPELIKMGASITNNGQKLIIEGGKELAGTVCNAHDLRAGAALLLAAANAKGQTLIRNADQIERGYTSVPEKFGKLGMKITET